MIPESRRPDSNVFFRPPIQAPQHRRFSNSGDMPSSQTGLYPETFPASSHLWAVLARRQGESLHAALLIFQLLSFLQSNQRIIAQPVSSVASAFFTRRFDWGQGQLRRVAHPRTSWIFSGRMALAVAPLLFLQLVLGPTLVVDIRVQIAIKNFRNLHIDYPRIIYPVGFQGYCNGMMAYVRGREQRWYCPSTHYMIHAPWTTILKFCKYCESFCENYNEYCTLTQDTFPLTICSLVTKQAPTSCRYNGTLTNQRLYLLCSQKYDAEPIGIIGSL